MSDRPTRQPHLGLRRQRAHAVKTTSGATEELFEVDSRDQRLDVIETDWTSATVRPETVLAALMVQAPGDSLQESLEDAAVLIEAINYAIECLSLEDIWILNAIQHEGITYDELAIRLGVSRTQGWRLHARSLKRLKTLLLNHPPVRERLGMKPTWNAAAMTELIAIASYEEDWPEGTTEYLIEDAVSDVSASIELAVKCLDAGRELSAVHGLTEAARYSVSYLRCTRQWKLLDMHTLLCSKMTDYGHGNINKFGMVGVIVRSSDKSERLKNLVTHRQGVTAVNETVKDTFDDVIGYAVIARMLKAETFTYELENGGEE